MPRSCSFGLCKNIHGRDVCRFFKFPSSRIDPDRRRLWAVRCSRKTADGRLWQPNPESEYVYVCSDHFITGEPWNHRDHPDYAPNLHNGLERDEQQVQKCKQALQRFLTTLNCRLNRSIIPTPAAARGDTQDANLTLTGEAAAVDAELQIGEAPSAGTEVQTRETANAVTEVHDVVLTVSETDHPCSSVTSPLSVHELKALALVNNETNICSASNNTSDSFQNLTMKVEDDDSERTETGSEEDTKEFIGTHLVDKTGQNVVLHKFTDTTESHLHGQRQQDETKPRKPEDCDRPGAKNKRDHSTVGTVSARKRMKKLPANVHPPGTFEAVRSDAYRLVVESKVWHILDDGSDSNSLTIGIIQRHQSFLSVRITAEDLMAEVAVYGIPRQTKDCLADKSLATLMDEISSMSVCPGIVEPELQCLADFPQHGEQRAFFRHLTYSLDGDSWTHSSRILSTNCARLITPSENICTACESVYKHLLSTE